MKTPEHPDVDRIRERLLKLVMTFRQEADGGGDAHLFADVPFGAMEQVPFVVVYRSRAILFDHRFASRTLYRRDTEHVGLDYCARLVADHRITLIGFMLDSPYAAPQGFDSLDLNATTDEDLRGDVMGLLRTGHTGVAMLAHDAMLCRGGLRLL